MKITSNFLVISAYNHDLSWVPEYTQNYLIYDRSPKPTLSKGVDPKKVVVSPNVGYNSYDYCRFIVDHYDNLPACTIFAKGWTFPRHVRKTYFERVMNNQCFTPLEDHSLYTEKWPVSFLSCDGGLYERNNSWYLHHQPTKFFHNYNDFLRFCFKDPVIPRYVRLAPGGDYIIPAENILKYPRVFYDNLRLFMSHDQHAGETHIIERTWHAIMTSPLLEPSEAMLKPIDDSFVPIPRPDRSTKLGRALHKVLPIADWLP